MQQQDSEWRLKTPNYDTLEDVYGPEEDTFLFLDALEKDLPSIVELRPRLCVEVGSGTGVVICSLANFLGTSSQYVAIDSNPKAVDCTVHNLASNGIRAQCVNGYLLNPLIETCSPVDLILFNPPYVITSSKEVGQKGLPSAWAGGINGREVIDRFLEQVPQVLTERGVLYLVLLKENLLDGTLDSILQLLPGFTGDIIMTRKAGCETLSVAKFFKKKKDMTRKT